MSGGALRPGTVVGVMARFPEPGRVKTRLARSLGNTAACELYCAFLRDLQARLRDTRQPVIWLVDPPDRDLRVVLGPEAVCRAQWGRDLGERMRRAFEELLAAGYTRIVIIGGDVPHLRVEWLDEAAAALDFADVVLGPAVDGGYYLIAMGTPHDLFSGVPMSTRGALKATLARARAAGLRVHLVPRTFDVDEIADLDRLREELMRPGAPPMPHTRAVVNRLSLIFDSQERS
jgi:rSAM/selenodomain-associated transferase 1